MRRDIGEVVLEVQPRIPAGSMTHDVAGTPDGGLALVTSTSDGGLAGD